jgi:hypothetical protein
VRPALRSAIDGGLAAPEAHLVGEGAECKARDAATAMGDGALEPSLHGRHVERGGGGDVGIGGGIGGGTLWRE